MYEFNPTPLEPVNSDWMRSHLRLVLDRVQMRQARFAIVRRGQEVAGLVPIHEARALWEVAHKTERYLEWQAQKKRDEFRRLRDAVAEQKQRA